MVEVGWSAEDGLRGEWEVSPASVPGSAPASAPASASASAREECIWDSSFLGKDVVVFLRPGNVVRIGGVVLEVHHDRDQPALGRAGVIIDTDDEEQEQEQEQVIKSEKMDLPSNFSQTLSTPADGTTVKIETIMETPAASRYGVLSNPIGITSGLKTETKTREELSIRLDQTEEDSQFPGPSAKSAKRKWLNEEDEVRDSKATFHVEDPENEPVTDSKPDKRQTPNPATVSTSTGTGIKVMFASSTLIHRNAKMMTFLTRNGVRKVESVAECDMLCVGNVKKTSNLVLAVLHGKQIIDHSWVKDSCVHGFLQNTADYLARDPAQEAVWGTTLSEAVERGKGNLKPLRNRLICFTAAARKELGTRYSQLKEIALLAGAKNIRLGFRRIKDSDWLETLIIIGGPDDHDLWGLEQEGYTGYSKDIITISVLRGKLDNNSDEFVIQGSEPDISWMPKHNKPLRLPIIKEKKTKK